uniref:ATP synthase CF1 delta subunit n=1 Tax=Synarthrophyton chejuense TaxID=2485825 RepID=A0A3G3MFI4_9FLOR|nr:ATP synthase CF1 delta subunit [Synarthrophyton chejuense]AYR05580.1 ATP synthase CF1 delta subunit [Synarthrophyton chejuense]
MSQSISFAKAAFPYAEALFESSKLMKLIEKTNQDLVLITDTISQSDNLKTFLLNPLVGPEIKKKVLHKLFLDQVSSHVLNFLSILADRRRINLLNPIISYYLELVYKLKLTTVANIYTAVLITDIQQESLKKKIKNITHSREVKLIIQINEELIAGFVIKIGSKIIDMSISGQINQMTSYLDIANL